MCLLDQRSRCGEPICLPPFSRVISAVGRGGLRRPPSNVINASGAARVYVALVIGWVGRDREGPVTVWTVECPCSVRVEAATIAAVHELPSHADAEAIDELVGRLRSELDSLASRIERYAG